MNQAENLLKSNNENKKEIESKCLDQLNIKIKRFQGLIIALVAAFFFSLSGVLNRKASIFSGSEQAAIRYFMQMILMLFTAWYHKVNIFGPREQRKLLLSRGILGSIAFISLGFSLKYINPSDTQTLFNTRLVIISILARIFLKEKLTIIHIVCLILTISGVFLISQPSFLIRKMNSTSTEFKNDTTNSSSQSHSIFPLIGFTLGLTSACAASCVAILIKKLSDLEVHYSINVIYSSYAGLPTALAISLIMYLTGVRNVDPSVYDTTEKLAWQIFYGLSSAACACFYQLLITLSNKHENANILALISSSNLFWSFLLQYFLLQISSNLLSLIGAFLIFLAILLSIIMKIIDQSLKRKSPKLKESNFFIRTLKRIIMFKF
jgi:drug/metabolite transporter (DMT)-like permease